MHNIVTIENVSLPIIEHEGQRVVTLAMIDKTHQRPDGTARRNFNTNRDKLVEGEDFFSLSPSQMESMDEFRTSVNPKGILLLSESGYLMLVKSFQDELAWKVQRVLVKTYFRARDEAQDINSRLSDPASLRQILLAYTEKVLALEAKVREQTPKVEFHDAVSESVNCQSIQEIAKALGTGQNRLFKFLRDARILMANNLPYQQYLDSGYFRVAERRYKDEAGDNHIYTKTLVTGKGLVFIQRRLQNLPLDMGPDTGPA